MQHDSTPQDSAPCTCEVCQFIQVMAKHVSELPQDLDGMGDSLALVLLSPEARESFKPVLRRFDSMGRSGRRQTARVLAEMDETQRSLATILLDPEARDALKSMVRAADRGDV